MPACAAAVCVCAAGGVHMSVIVIWVCCTRQRALRERCELQRVCVCACVYVLAIPGRFGLFTDQCVGCVGECGQCADDVFQ